ncbi:MAG: DUF308 domain-containing protein [Ruminococcus sp.]|nr:DUF308 domain-containing protein [Ruminococcus sp.]
MKKTLNAFWIISSIFLAVAALWGVISGLASVMGTDTMCGIALIVFGVISVLAFFTAGIKANGSGWLLFDGISSFFCGLAFIFWYVDNALFTVNLIYIMGLWLMFLGISQVARASRVAKSFGRVLMSATGVLAVLGGLSLYVRPVSDLLLISEAMALFDYTATFQLIFAAVLVISRCFAKEPSKR